VKDCVFDWIDVNKHKNSLQGEPATDIVGVSYFSDGQTLNSTIWLMAQFIRQPFQYNALSYCVMVDSDYDKNTRVCGVDYQLEISWINKTKLGIKRLRSGQPLNMTNFWKKSESTLDCVNLCYYRSVIYP
jgi:hypothetical protein